MNAALASFLTSLASKGISENDNKAINKNDSMSFNKDADGNIYAVDTRTNKQRQLGVPNNAETFNAKAAEERNNTHQQVLKTQTDYGAKLNNDKALAIVQHNLGTPVNANSVYANSDNYDDAVAMQAPGSQKASNIGVATNLRGAEQNYATITDPNYIKAKNAGTIAAAEAPVLENFQRGNLTAGNTVFGFGLNDNNQVSPTPNFTATGSTTEQGPIDVPIKMPDGSVINTTRMGTTRIPAQFKTNTPVLPPGTFSIPSPNALPNTGSSTPVQPAPVTPSTSLNATSLNATPFALTQSPIQPAPSLTNIGGIPTISGAASPTPQYNVNGIQGGIKTPQQQMQAILALVNALKQTNSMSATTRQ